MGHVSNIISLYIDIYSDWCNYSQNISAFVPSELLSCHQKISGNFKTNLYLNQIDRLFSFCCPSLEDI